jgi:urea transport system permease protein
VFVVSAMMAGVAGALYVPQVGIINPGEFAPANSIEVVIWTAVGAAARWSAPIIGADRRQYAARAISPRRSRSFWLFALGALFVAVDAVPAARGVGPRDRCLGQPDRQAVFQKRG